MSHYEERLQCDLERIRDRVVASAGYANGAVGDAIQALLHDNRKLAYDTILGDLALNRQIRALDRLCHAFIARHLPSAGHLRFVSSVLRINVAVERIGDYAVTVARESTQLSRRPPQEICRDLEAMARQSLRTLTQATEAFAGSNAELARGTIAMARQVDTTFDAVFYDLLESGGESRRPLRDLFALFAAFNRIERVSDQAKNICEETVFAATGQGKEPKRYRVLFVDADNSRLSLMAEAIAAKAYPGVGEFASAGWDPAPEISPGFEAFMNERGHSVENRVPASLTDRAEFLTAAHVLVSLAADPSERLEVPFHTIVRVWDVGEIPSGLDRDREDAVLDTVYKDLALRIEDLMAALHGEEIA